VFAAAEPGPEAPLSSPPAPASRLLGIAVALVMAFGAIVMAITMSDLDGTPTCAAVRSGAASVPADRKCFDGSAARKSIVFAIGIAGAAAAAVAGVAGIALAAGRPWRRLLLAAVALALALSGLSILIGAV
jgi:hypothetical protein